ncbi:hypothetical protein SAY87_004759 [Trapa incisa]|uniref:Ion transport domain-containing protein n=1 Tax=Trapa incisa TaxID=236973 RepID=A0AAN7PLC5_9MYRT|nr:hypothetical protein SAY87_004759 [Trapa incisa]
MLDRLRPLLPSRWVRSGLTSYCWPSLEAESHAVNDSEGSGSGNFYASDGIGRDSPVSLADAVTECYACTQPGVPAFHSTTCHNAYQLPEWEASAGSSLFPVQSSRKSVKGARSQPNNTGSWATHLFLPVLDPRSKKVQRWNRGQLLARGMALAVDPLFFYVLSISGRGPPEEVAAVGGCAPCLYMDVGLATIVTVVRTSLDAAHLMHMWLQFRLAYVSRESLVVGCGKLVWDPCAIAHRYAHSIKGLWFDLFVILPIPQVVVWLIIPKLAKEEHVKLIMPMLLVLILFQFLPKVYHSIYLMRRMRKVTGYIFGSIWWGFGLNLIAYFIASHAAGGCWYVLAVQRVLSCVQWQCAASPKCSSTTSCSDLACHQFWSPGPTGQQNISCIGKRAMGRIPRCLDENGMNDFGIYSEAVPVISSNSLSVRILYPIFWGLLNLSTFANELAPTSELLEVIFSILIVLCGLMLFTLLVGNIQVFLHAVMVKKKKMQLRFRDIEWWMKRRQLPSQLRQRVYHFEHQRWAALGGEEEMEVIKDLPDGLRRDIKRYLCLDLIRKVPLFHDLDDIILDNICDRVQPLLYSKDEKGGRSGAQDGVHHEGPRPSGSEPEQGQCGLECARIRRLPGGRAPLMVHPAELLH